MFMELTAPISDVTGLISITSSNRIDDGSSQGLAMSFPEHSTCLKAELPCGERGQGLSLALCTQ
jgi:hypothetical protein